VTKSYLRYALAVIFFANFFSYLDRQVVSSIEHELKRDLHISTAEFGYVGSAFTVGYMVFAPVIGFLITRVRRPAVFAMCIIVWSFATVASGLVPNKWGLYAARFFIGVGEAGCLVIGPTLLSDYFSKEVRGRVLSIFFLAMPLGGANGYILGAQITKHLGWHWAFYLAGAPGFLLAVLIWFLVDPEPCEDPGERHPDTADGHHGHPPPVRGLKPYLDLLSNRTLLYIILAQAFAVMFLQPFLHFGVGFFESERDLTKSKATLSLASIALVAGALGNALSGFIGDRMARRTRGAYALMAGLAFIFGLPFMLAGFTLRVPHLYLPALGVGAFCYFLCMPAVNTQIANSVSPEKRAMAYALAVFILHCLGDTAALPAFGRVADVVGSKQASFTIFSFALLLAGLSCILAFRSAARDGAPRSDRP
jgi:predicted MFS family arabinose efflux permease